MWAWICFSYYYKSSPEAAKLTSSPKPWVRVQPAEFWIYWTPKQFRFEKKSPAPRWQSFETKWHRDLILLIFFQTKNMVSHRTNRRLGSLLPVTTPAAPCIIRSRDSLALTVHSSAQFRTVRRLQERLLECLSLVAPTIASDSEMETGTVVDMDRSLRPRFPVWGLMLLKEWSFDGRIWRCCE